MDIYELTEDNSRFSEAKIFSIGTGKKYYITKNSTPYLIAEADSTDNPFDTACIFGKYLCIGIYEKIAFVDLITLSTRFDTIDSWYFGDFVIYNDILFVLSDVGITAYDKDLNILWKNSGLAYDGVCIYGISDDGEYLEVSCELDPPDGCRVHKKVDIKTGNESEAD